MADCAALLDEELSSFVFSYLTEPPGGQDGEGGVASERLDFPDIDLSQLDAGDFDSVHGLEELPWCSEQPDTSPSPAHYSTADQLFEMEEENAALLAALTDSLDGMVDEEGGGLTVFPALGEEPDEEEEEYLPVGVADLKRPLGGDTEDPSLLKKLLLTPPNAPVGVDAHKDRGQRHSRGLHLRQLRPLVKTDLPQERKPRPLRPVGRLCTELHRHLTTAQDLGGPPAPDTEDDDEEEEEEDSESEEEEEESSSSEAEGVAAAAEPAPPQFSSEKELQSVVELITYMHTYCLPSRKQQGWDRQDPQRPRARPEPSRLAATSSHSRVVLVASPGTCGGPTGVGSGALRRLPFARRRELKVDSLLRELLQQSRCFDVSQPYRLHSPPYCHPHGDPCSDSNSAPCCHPHSPNRGGAGASASATTIPPPHKDCSPHNRKKPSSWEGPRSQEEAPEGGGSFSVRRSRRLATFPSRFAKRLGPARPRDGEGDNRAEERGVERAGLKVPPTQAGGGTTTAAKPERRISCNVETMELSKPCCHKEKRVCLCLPLDPKTSGDVRFGIKPFEPALGVDLSGTAGLTPPTTPPHKPVEDELFKAAEGGKGGDAADGGGELVHPAANASMATKGWWQPSRAPPQRRLLEQTELYAHLRRVGVAGDGGQRSFGDHDYCALSLGERRRRSAAMLAAILQAQGGRDRIGAPPTAADHQEPDQEDRGLLPEAKAPLPSDCSSAAATPPSSEEEAEASPASPSHSPCLRLCPDSPANKTESRSEFSPHEEPRTSALPDEFPYLSVWFPSS
ncbi:peroxisome proliferator-activated receptor gamma coactivator 1-beta isoform X2 [Antennarius striatus]|uniref:peroxisome proliferator-activated receptor gamma coactivator 1-beta isoform X2 n=1 Tax=Antennarius striatus TaxID=241820 RepID=UPI0035B42367